MTHFTSTIYTPKGGLRYDRFIDALLDDIPLGLIVLSLDSVDGPHGGLVKRNATFLRHDREHWETFVTAYINLTEKTSDQSNQNLMPLYRQIWAQKPNLPKHEQRIIRVVLFALLHEQEILSASLRQIHCSGEATEVEYTDGFEDLLNTHNSSNAAHLLNGLNVLYIYQKENIKTTNESEAYRNYSVILKKIIPIYFSDFTVEPMLDLNCVNIKSSTGHKHAVRFAMQKESENPHDLSEIWILTDIDSINSSKDPQELNIDALLNSIRILPNQEKKSKYSVMLFYISFFTKMPFIRPAA